MSWTDSFSHQQPSCARRYGLVGRRLDVDIRAQRNGVALVSSLGQNATVRQISPGVDG